MLLYLRWKRAGSGGSGRGIRLAAGLLVCWGLRPCPHKRRVLRLWVLRPVGAPLPAW